MEFLISLAYNTQTMNEKPGITPAELELMGDIFDSRSDNAQPWMITAVKLGEGTLLVDHGNVTPGRRVLFNKIHEILRTNMEMETDGIYATFSESGEISPERREKIFSFDLEDDKSSELNSPSVNANNSREQDLAPTFRSRLKQLRKGFNPPLKQQEVAERAGISVDWYRAIEQERAKPSIQALVAIGLAVGLNKEDTKSFVRLYPRR